MLVPRVKYDLRRDCLNLCFESFTIWETQEDDMRTVTVTGTLVCLSSISFPALLTLVEPVPHNIS
jgi:hypothetical protein